MHVFIALMIRLMLIMTISYVAVICKVKFLCIETFIILLYHQNKWIDLYVLQLYEAKLFLDIPNKHSVNQIKYTSVKLKSDTYMGNGQLIRIRIVRTYIHITYMRCSFIRNIFISLSKCIWTYKTKTFLVKM